MTNRYDETSVRYVEEHCNGFICHAIGQDIPGYDVIRGLLRCACTTAAAIGDHSADCPEVKIDQMADFVYTLILDEFKD